MNWKRIASNHGFSHLPGFSVHVDVVPEGLPPGPVPPLLAEHVPGRDEKGDDRSVSMTTLPAVSVDVDDHALVGALGVLLAVLGLVQEVAALGPAPGLVLGLAALVLGLLGGGGGGGDPGPRPSPVLRAVLVLRAVIVLLHHGRRRSPPPKPAAAAPTTPIGPAAQSLSEQRS